MSDKEQTSEHCQYRHSHHAGYCDLCGIPLSPIYVEDYGTLCERCYLKEYYESEE